jgi:pimeloyl-ACP methyl ester carboxylesterase
MTRTPLVLVPGLLCDALLWQDPIQDLADISDCWVADHTGASDMAKLAGNILAAVPFERFALAGLSMGGYVAMEIMRQTPARVTRLALLDTSAHPDTPEQTERRLAFVDLAERGRFMSVTDALLPLLIHRARAGDAALVATIRCMARNIGRQAFAYQQKAIISRADSRSLLPHISCPALVLCGRQDQLTPLDRHEEMARAISGARLVVVEDCGHLSTLEQPQEVSRAMRHWLTGA